MEKFKGESSKDKLEKEKDKFTREVESIHAEYLELKPLIFESIDLQQKENLDSKDKERIAEIEEKKEKFKEKFQREVVKITEWADDNFSQLEWSFYPTSGIGKVYQTDIGKGFKLEISFDEIEPGQPVIDPVSKDEFIRHYSADITGPENKPNQIGVTDRINAQFKDKKSIAERGQELEARNEFEKKLIELSKKLGGI